MTAVAEPIGREADLVELVDEDGDATGSCTVQAAHNAPGRLHRAFSVLLFDPDGRILLQQRAAGKTRFALRWANACCGHPLPGESAVAAAGRRMAEELRLERVPLTEVGVYRYRAADPATARVEHEYDHVLCGEVPAGLVIVPDPSEVADLRWVDQAALADDLVRRGSRYAPWLAGVVQIWLASRDPVG